MQQSPNTLLHAFHGCFNRKNSFPVGGLTMIYLIVSLSVGAGDAPQLAVVKSVFCCRFQPVEGDGQEIIAVLVVVIVMVSVGVPGVGTAEIRAQKAPTKP